MTDIKQQARELLRSECQKIGVNSVMGLETAALRAIEAALRVRRPSNPPCTCRNPDVPFTRPCQACG